MRPQGSFARPGGGKDPGTGFRIPPPRGIRPRGVEADPEELRRFSGGGEPQDARVGKRTGGGYVTEGAVAAARTRQAGGRAAVPTRAAEAEEEDDAYDLDALGEAEEAEEEEAPEIEPSGVITRGEQYAQETSRFTPLADAAVFGRPAAPAAHVPPPPGLALRPVYVEDADRLWDWLRADADKGETFFGKVLRNSQELHDLMKTLLMTEQQGTGLARMIWFVDQQGVQHHIGVAMLVPILSQERVALMHLFLRPDVRGNLPNFVAPLVAEGRALVPGYHLAYFALTAGAVAFGTRVLGPLGFKACTMFVL